MLQRSTLDRTHSQVYTDLVGAPRGENIIPVEQEKGRVRQGGVEFFFEAVIASPDQAGFF
jgi:hypothetical protein